MENKIFVANSDYQIKIPLPTKHDDSSNESSPELNGGMVNEFDRLLQSRWDMHMNKGHFRYGLDVVETRLISSTGKYPMPKNYKN